MAEDSKSRSLVTYDISKESDKLTIKARVQLPAFNKIVLSILAPGYILFVLWLIYIAITEGAPIWFFGFIIVLIVISIAFSKGLIKFSTKNRNWTLTVDKASESIQCPNENFRTKINSIKSVSLTDIHTVFTGLFSGTALGLKFSTEAGDKTLMFPIDTYERGEEIVKAINFYIK